MVEMAVAPKVLASSHHRQILSIRGLQIISNKHRLNQHSVRPYSMNITCKIPFCFAKIAIKGNCQGGTYNFLYFQGVIQGFLGGERFYLFIMMKLTCSWHSYSCREYFFVYKRLGHKRTYNHTSKHTKLHHHFMSCSLQLRKKA